MKKTFPLSAPGKAAARVVDAIKHDVRKYVKRERAKTVPEGFDHWTFQCRVGASAATAETCELADVTARIDAVVATESPGVYIEIVAAAANRAPRNPVPPSSPAPASAPTPQSS